MKPSQFSFTESLPIHEVCNCIYDAINNFRQINNCTRIKYSSKQLSGLKTQKRISQSCIEMAKLYMGLGCTDLLMLPEAGISHWFCIKKRHRNLKLEITFSSLASPSLSLCKSYFACLSPLLAQISLWQKDWKTWETFPLILVNVTIFIFYQE